MPLSQKLTFALIGLCIALCIFVLAPPNLQAQSPSPSSSASSTRRADRRREPEPAGPNLALPDIASPTPKRTSTPAGTGGRGEHPADSLIAAPAPTADVQPPAPAATGPAAAPTEGAPPAQTPPGTITESNPSSTSAAKGPQEIKAEATLDPSRETYLVNRNLFYRIVVRWKGAPEAVLPQLPEQLDLTNLEIVDKKVEDFSALKNGEAQMIYCYTLSPPAVGSATIGPIVVHASTNDGRALPEIEIPSRTLKVAARSRGWLKPIGWTVALAAILALAAWLASVSKAFSQRQRYRDAMRDDTPSIDERLQSELITVRMVLLRGNIAAYYEKMLALLRQLMKNRGLLSNLEAPSDKILERLKAADVDPAFYDCAESILQRCDAVLERSDKPDEAAHAKIAKDLKILISMNPHAGPHRPRERRAESSPLPTPPKE